MGTPPEPVRATITVPHPLREAFATFTDGLGSWWPREYTWSQDVLERIGLEPRQDGRCYEIGPHGFHSDWGRVLAWEPPRRLVLAWQISPKREPEPNPAKASEVEVRFETGAGGETTVGLEHRGFERHGPDAAGYRHALASPQGWPWILERYAAAAVFQRSPPAILVVPPNSGRTIEAGGSIAQFKLEGRDTDETFCLAVVRSPPGAGPPPHVHRRDDEAFVVLEGELSFLTTSGWVSAPAGTVVYAPRGAPHTYRNVGSSPSRHLVLNLPSGFDRFYQRWGELFAHGGTPSREQLQALAEAFGYELLDPETLPAGH